MNASITRERLKAVPNKPGVYLMKDAQGEVIYVGKAKNLKSRVRSYFNESDTRYTVQFLLERVRTIETVVTENERQALVLEADLITKFKPRYNIRLKDDKSHLLVRVNSNHDYPRLELVRERKDDGALYLGPFVFAHELHALLDIVSRTFPLRTCNDRTFSNRVRPCLEYQIKRCAGPCCLTVSKNDYALWLKQAIQVLEGKNVDVAEQVERSMEKAAELLQFEDAAKLRDRLEILKTVKKEPSTVGYEQLSLDAIGIYREGKEAEVSVLQVRRGRLYEAQSFSFSDVSIPDDEIISAFLSQFYVSSAPEEILLPFELEDLESSSLILSENRNTRTLVPLKGAKARLVRLAESNAKENFRSRSSSNSPVELEELRQLLELDEIPRTIECADISHFQGSQTVASVVFFKDGKPQKDKYRHFTLAIQGKPDDFASMYEVVFRHLSRALEENTIVDLLVIDGGKQQLAKALEARSALGLNRPEIISLAKKRRIKFSYRAHLSPGMNRANEYKPERVFLPSIEDAKILKPDSRSLNLLERIRDEAHNFAVNFHRQKRKKELYKSSLDGIMGLGPRRKLELLREFKSLKAIADASVEEIINRCKIPEKVARALKENL